MTKFPHVEHWDKIGRIPTDVLDSVKGLDPYVIKHLKEYCNLLTDGSFDSKGLPLDIIDRLEGALQKIDDRLTQERQAYEAEQKAELEKQAQIIRDRNAAIARLDWYEKERGLVNNQHNADAINDWIMNAEELKGAKGCFNPQTIDIAISFLGKKGSNVLQWQVPKPATPPPPAAPAGVLGTCSDGLPELPLNTIPARHHSVAQLKNLDQRQRKARGPVKNGWHGGGAV
jgi:hypothetical protein